MSGDQRRAGILWKENDLPGIGAYKRIKGADFPLLLLVLWLSFVAATPFLLPIDVLY